MDATRDAELELSEEEGIPSSAEDDSVGKGVYSGPNAPKSRVFSRYPFAKKPEGNRIIYIYIERYGENTLNITGRIDDGFYHYRIVKTYLIGYREVLDSIRKWKGLSYNRVFNIPQNNHPKAME